MSKVKVKTLIGSVVTVAFFLTVIVAFLFYAFPENVALATGFGPYDGLRILTFSAILVAAMLLFGWLIEKAFDFAGKSGLYFHWGQKKAQMVAPATGTIASEDDEEEPVFSEDAVSEHLRFRYGRRWQRKVRILLVMGNPDDVQKAAPGLSHDLWQEGDGNVLIYGGDAQSLPDEIFLSKLVHLRSGQPIDGIIQVMSTSALPTDSERDAFLRCRQKGMALTSGEDMQLAAARNVVVNAGGDISVGTMGNLTALAGEKLGLFARTGQLSVKSGEGPIDVQAQNASLRFFAEKKLTLSSANDISLAGKKRITLIGGGSYLRLEAGKVEYGTTASYLRKVKRTMFAGATNLPIESLKQMVMITQYYDRKLNFSSNVNYRVETMEGEEILSGSGADGYIDKKDSESEYWVFLS